MPKRIAGADQLLVGERDQRIGALDPRKRLDETLDDAWAPRSRGQQQHDLRVRRRLADRALANEFAPQRQAVGQVAVVRDRQAARVEFGEQRLHVAQDGRAGGGVADMADGGRAGQPLDRRGAGEMIADEAEPPLRVEPRAVERYDAGRLLAPVLQGVQPERGDRGGVGMSENAEHPALLVQAVVREID